MQVELTEQQIEAIGKSFARAQLTAADDVIAESTANWPDEFKTRLDVENSKPGTNQVIRFENFRAIRKDAERAIQQAADKKAEIQRTIEETQRKGEERRQQLADQDSLRHKADMAKWEMEAANASRNGMQPPSKPVPARSGEELERLQYSGSLAQNF